MRQQPETKSFLESSRDFSSLEVALSSTAAAWKRPSHWHTSSWTLGIIAPSGVGELLPKHHLVHFLFPFPHCVFPALHRYIPISFLLLHMPLSHFWETAKGDSTYIIHHHQRYSSSIVIRHGIWERRSETWLLQGVWVERFLVSGWALRCLGHGARNDKTKILNLSGCIWAFIYL